MANIIAVSTAEGASADITLTAGQSTTLYITAAAGAVPQPNQSVASIQQKGSTGSYMPIGTLTGAAPSLVLQAIGTFRVFKFASASAFGVDRD